MPRQYILWLHSRPVQLWRRRLYIRQRPCVCAPFACAFPVARAFPSRNFTWHTADGLGENSHHLPRHELAEQPIHSNDRERERCGGASGA